jgi:hypothetical protein
MRKIVGIAGVGLDPSAELIIVFLLDDGSTCPIHWAVDGLSQIVEQHTAERERATSRTH